MQKLLTYPDHRLLQISGYVRDFKDPKLKELIKQMKEIISNENLKALAAIQIGVPLRVVVLKRDGEYFVMINPTIFGKEGDIFLSTESDESLPNAKLTVPRYPKVKIMYQDEEAKEHFYTASGEEATILQRKIDMIFGGYLFDKLPKKEQKKFFKEYGNYGDTCPTYFIKDRILQALKFFMVLHFISIILSFFFDRFSFVLEHNTLIAFFELMTLIIYAFYAKYETTKYKNCTSCQGANIIGTSALYFVGIVILFTLSFIGKMLLF
jgi:peptide deformylase